MHVIKKSRVLKLDVEIVSFKIRLGKRIKFLREKQGLTQVELGARINKDYQVIGRIENGRVNPSAYLVYQIAQALHVTASEIYDSL